MRLYDIIAYLVIKKETPYITTQTGTTCLSCYIVINNLC